MDRNLDNGSGTSDLKTLLFDMKSDQSKLNTNEEEATSSGLQSEELRYQIELNKLRDLEMEFIGVGGNDIVGENQKSRCFGSDSKIVKLDSRSERKSEFCKNYKLDSSESLYNTDVVDAAVEAEETIEVTTPLNNNPRFRRIKWITSKMVYLMVIILFLGYWMEPQCCDMQNNYKWSFDFGLRYINGPPPT